LETSHFLAELNNNIFSLFFNESGKCTSTANVEWLFSEGNKPRLMSTSISCNEIPLWSATADIVKTIQLPNAAAISSTGQG